MLTEARPEVTVRIANPEDAPVCGQICFEAFAAITTEHGFPSDFPEPEIAIGFLTAMFSSPGAYCVVAESGGRIVGSNVLDERSVIGGVGPIAIDPTAQNLGVGRKLMLAVIHRSKQPGAAGIRLTQAAFHNRSLALYASLGFDVREPLSCMQRQTHTRSIPGCSARPARPDDVEACNALASEHRALYRSFRCVATLRALLKRLFLDLRLRSSSVYCAASIFHQNNCL